MKIRTLLYFVVLGSVAFLNVPAQSVADHWGGPRYTAWSALEPVSALNTAAGNELPNSISNDGEKLYFTRDGDIFVSHKRHRRSDWGSPVKLPDTINTTAAEGNAFETTDGHWLYFGSTRPGGLGGSDIWVSYRRNVRDDMGWGPPVNLTGVNTAGFENGPMLFENEETGITEMYFAGSPCAALPCPAGSGAQPFADIYMSTFGPNGFGAPVMVPNINVSTHHDGKPYLRRDGLELFFASYRLGPPDQPFSTGGAIFVSTRSSTDDPWSDPTVTIIGSTPGNSGDRWVTTPVLSWDAETIYVGVNQSGIDRGDIYVAHREKIGHLF